MIILPLLIMVKIKINMLIAKSFNINQVKYIINNIGGYFQ